LQIGTRKNITMKFLLINIIRLYQKIISPLLGSNCRFYPTCSSYTIEAIEKKGVVVGVLIGIWRILRCNPLNKNFGYDPVEKGDESGREKFK